MVIFTDKTNKRLDELADLEALKELATGMFGEDVIGSINSLGIINVYYDKHKDKYPICFNCEKIKVEDKNYLEAVNLFAERAEEIIRRYRDETSSPDDTPCSFKYKVVADFSREQRPN